MKGLISTNYSQNSHGNIKYSIQNIVHDIVIATYGARWVLEILEGTICEVYGCLATMLCP